jgi:hypothetical protein
MAAPKGNKFAGNRKGIKNKKTTEIIESITWVLSLLETTLQQDIALLKPNERANLWNNLQEYIRPKLARTEAKIKVETDTFDISLKID